MGSIPGWSKSTKEYVTKKGRLAIELRGAQGPARSGGVGGEGGHGGGWNRDGYSYLCPATLVFIIPLK